MTDKKRRQSYLAGWTLYPLCCLGHHLSGLLTALAALSRDPAITVAGAMYLALYIAYQALSVLRKADSPGLDIADFMVGFGAGLAGIGIGTLLV